jgi:hypothetical protein
MTPPMLQEMGSLVQKLAVYVGADVIRGMASASALLELCCSVRLGFLQSGMIAHPPRSSKQTCVILGTSRTCSLYKFAVLQLD